MAEKKATTQRAPSEIPKRGRIGEKGRFGFPQSGVPLTGRDSGGLEIKIPARGRKGFPTGFTLIELAVTVVASTIVILTIGIILADSHRGWNRMYSRIYSDVMTDSYVARKTFDSVTRQASSGAVDVGGTWLEVYYYASADSTVVDRYARFYQSGDELKVEHGSLDPREALSIRTICRNVQRCVFKIEGRSAQMILTLNDGSQVVTTVSSAFMHN